MSPEELSSKLTQDIKYQIGEFTFQVLELRAQNEAQMAEIAKLKAEIEDLKKQDDATLDVPPASPVLKPKKV